MPQNILALRNLLLKLFDPDELRMFLHLELGEDGEHLIKSLPGSNASAEVVAYKAVVALERRGLLDGHLFDALVQVRPRREADIRQVQKRAA